MGRQFVDTGWPMTVLMLIYQLMEAWGDQWEGYWIGQGDFQQPARIIRMLQLQVAVVGGCRDFLWCVTFSIPSGSIFPRKHGKARTALPCRITENVWRTMRKTVWMEIGDKVARQDSERYTPGKSQAASPSPTTKAITSKSVILAPSALPESSGCSR